MQDADAWENGPPPSDDSSPESSDSSHPFDDSSPQSDDSSATSNVPKVENPTPPSDDSGPDDDEEEEVCFNELFDSFSSQWLTTQLTHRVSLEASNAFWVSAMNHIPRIFELKKSEGIKGKIPQFMQENKHIKFHF